MTFYYVLNFLSYELNSLCLSMSYALMGGNYWSKEKPAAVCKLPTLDDLTYLSLLLNSIL